MFFLSYSITKYIFSEHFYAQKSNFERVVYYPAKEIIINNYLNNCYLNIRNEKINNVN